MRSHLVPLLYMVKTPSFKYQIQMSSYPVILYIQQPDQNLCWILNRHLEIIMSITEVLALPHQPTSQWTNIIPQVTQAKKPGVILILFPSLLTSSIW